MSIDPHEYYEALDQLAWQADLGVSEAIEETPINRYEVAKEEKAKPVAQEQEIVKEVEENQAEVSAQIAKGCVDLDTLRVAIETFEGCDLKKGARNTVFSDGNPNARVMIIGEAPGRDEDREGRPFIGVSGQLLDKMLAAINLNRMAEEREDAVYITNIIPWRPPQNRDPSRQEIATMLPFVLRHIELVKPDFILMMGATSSKSLLDTTTGITRLRGTWHEVAGVPALPMFHPAALLRDALKKRPAWHDLLSLRDKLDG